jgi:hypothetical protein
MMLSILVALGTPLGVVILATLAGALLAPLDISGGRVLLRSQCPNRPAPTAIPYRGSALY